MTLRELLKKREKIRDDAGQKESASAQDSPPTQFTFMRTDTNTQELISPPTVAEDESKKDTPHGKSRFSRFRSASNVSTKSHTSDGSEKRLSSRLHLGSHSRSSSVGSVNIPIDLPAISDEVGGSEEKEAQWENRATILAQKNPMVKQSQSGENSAGGATLSGRPPIGRHISDAKGDVRGHRSIHMKGRFG